MQMQRRIGMCVIFLFGSQNIRECPPPLVCRIDETRALANSELRVGVGVCEARDMCLCDE